MTDVDNHPETFRTPIRRSTEDATAATARKRPREASKVSLLRTRKRQIEGSLLCETKVKIRQGGDKIPESESRVIKRTKCPEQKHGF
ncbi:hypothetical protein KRP22_014958 [Phytophthora ramorum]|nr:hypothetical protein KRP22_13985 [Phytophthora ramorum]